MAPPSAARAVGTRRRTASPIANRTPAHAKRPVTSAAGGIAATESRIATNVPPHRNVATTTAPTALRSAERLTRAYSRCGERVTSRLGSLDGPRQRVRNSRLGSPAWERVRTFRLGRRPWGGRFASRVPSLRSRPPRKSPPTRAGASCLESVRTPALAKGPRRRVPRSLDGARGMRNGSSREQAGAMDGGGRRERQRRPCQEGRAKRCSRLRVPLAPSSEPSRDVTYPLPRAGDRAEHCVPRCAGPRVIGLLGGGGGGGWRRGRG